MPKKKKNADIYVEVGSMAVKKSDLDVKTNKLPSVMTKATTEFFKKQSGFTIKKPSGKPKSGFKVSGNVVSLKKETKGKQELIMCTVSFALSELPRDKLVPGKLEGIGGVSVGKDIQGDAEFAVATATKEAAKMAAKQIEHATK